MSTGTATPVRPVPRFAAWLLLCAAGALLHASPAAGELPEHRPIPGGVAVVELQEAPPPDNAVEYDGEPVMVRERRGRPHAVVGIPLSADPGRHVLRAGEREYGFEVHPHEYAASRIEIPEEDLVTPPAEELPRIRDEQRRIRAAYRSRALDREPRLELAVPVPQGRPSSPFGLRRYINEQPRNPHNGLDLAAPTGTPVLAAEDGVVVESGHFYFNGKTLLIDHGSGLVTMYCHLDEMDVATGDRVERGQRIGTVGETGRVTGAHLHWTVTLNAHAVDPELFVGSALDELE